jgi:hypothetical protein
MPRFGYHVGCAFLSLFLVCAVVKAQSTAPPSTHPSGESSNEDQVVEKRLDRKMPSVQLPSVVLSDAFDFIRDITGENLFIDWKNLQLAGVTQQTIVKLQATDIPVREALTRILASTGSNALEFHVIDGVVIVSTKLDFEDRSKREGSYFAALSNQAAAAPVLDHHLQSVQLPMVGLSDAIDFMRDITGAAIEVKWDALLAVGVQTNTQVSAQFHDVRFSTVLNLLLDQAAEGKLGYIATPVKIRRMEKDGSIVYVNTALITISTIDDLKKMAATRPS